MKIEDCYNLHLKTIRSFKNKPFRLKKDFSDLEKHPSYKHYQNVLSFFNNNPTINPVVYFQATAFYHDKEDWIPIEEYTKSRSLTNYTQYITHLNSKELDSSFDEIKRSYKFILRFCRLKDIRFKDYLNHVEEGSNKPSYLIHYKRREINIYFLFVFEDFFVSLKKIYRHKEDYHFYIENEKWTPFEIRKRYMRSRKFRKAVELVRTQKLSEG